MSLRHPRTYATRTTKPSATMMPSAQPNRARVWIAVSTAVSPALSPALSTAAFDHWVREEHGLGLPDVEHRCDPDALARVEALVDRDAEDVAVDSGHELVEAAGAQ